VHLVGFTIEIEQLMSNKYENSGPTANLGEVVSRTISVAGGNVTETY